MKKIFYLILILVFTACNKSQVATVSIISENETFSFNAEIADEPTEREKGLMFRENLDEDSGMFFIFDETKILNFWMKNTLIQLDIIFIDEDFKIINIVGNAEPCVGKDIVCPGYVSELPAKYVLEIAGGRAKELGIKPADEVSIKGF